MNLGEDIGVELGAGLHGKCGDSLFRIMELRLQPGTECIQFIAQPAHQRAVGGVFLVGGVGLALCMIILFVIA